LLIRPAKLKSIEKFRLSQRISHLALAFALLFNWRGGYMPENKDKPIQTTQNGPQASDLAQAKEQLAPKTIEKSPSPGDEHAP